MEDDVAGMRLQLIQGDEIDKNFPRLDLVCYYYKLS